MNSYIIYILVMGDVDSLSLGYYPVNSPSASSPGVLGNDVVDPASFSRRKLDSDDKSLWCATFRLFKNDDIYIFRMN